MAKLKTHQETTVTLATKNIFGIPDVFSYISPRIPGGRFAMHDRGVNQAILDVTLLRSSDFSIIDGVWGMEGKGPLQGTPVAMNTVLAGRNALAVDRVGLAVMQVPQPAARHLNYLSFFGMGPSNLSNVDIVGDPLATHPFDIPLTPPNFEPPLLSSPTLNPSLGDEVSVSTTFHQQCFRLIEVVRVSDESPEVDRLRTLQPLSFQGVGTHVSSWDGRAEDETIVPPGRYAIRVSTRRLDFQSSPGAATSWVTVV